MAFAILTSTHIILNTHKANPLRPDDELEPLGIRQRINMIMGGSHYVDTISSKKAYQQRAEVDINWSKPSELSNDVISFDERETKENLTIFIIAMGCINFREGEDDASQCLFFVKNLCGPTVQWFSRLRQNLINDFNQLSAAFLKHHAY